MRNTRSCLIEGRDDCQQLKPKGSHTSYVTTVIALTILLMLSILFGRVTVHVLVFVLRFVFFHVIFLCNAVYQYDARRRDFAASFVSEFNTVF